MKYRLSAEPVGMAIALRLAPTLSSSPGVIPSTEIHYTLAYVIGALRSWNASVPLSGASSRRVIKNNE